MGAELSVPLSRIPDNTTIYQNTSNTIEVMNRILDFILTNSDMRDMISLTNQENCKRWLIIGEKNLSSIFDKVQISPQRNKDGTLYIKKLSILTKGQDSTAREGCRLLAFFFVRLFQIVGALSLSINDTKLPEIDYKPNPKVSIQEEKGRIPLLKMKENKPTSFLGMFRGGAASELPATLNFLDKHIQNSENILILRDPYFNTQRGLVYRSDPVGPDFLVEDQKLRTVYDIDQKNSISFILQKDPSKKAFNISDVLRNNISVTLDQTYYTYNSEKDIVKVTYKNKDISFTDFIGRNGLVQDILYTPKSLICQVFKKYKYLEETDEKRFFKLRNINISTNDIIYITTDDYMDNIDPEFVFTTEYVNENRKLKIIINFKLNIVEDKSEKKFIFKIKDIKNKTSGYEDIPLIFEQDDEEKDKDVEPEKNEKTEKSDDPNERIFRIKNGFGSSDQPTHGRTNQTIPQFINARIKSMYEKLLKEISVGYSKSKKGFLPLPINSDKDEFKVVKLWKAVASETPVKAFCTARALQLLDKSGLYSTLTPESFQFIQSTKLPNLITPHISDGTFELIKNKSLPGLGQSITTAEGISALDRLYDTPNVKLLPPISNSGFFGLFGSDPDKDRRKKQQSLEMMIRSFKLDEKQLSNTISELSQINDINPSKINSFDPRKEATKLKSLRLQAVKLFQIQFTHTQKVNNILNKIFKIGNTIELKPDILSKGVYGIEEIAHEARDVLTDYYSGCQTEYVKGVNILTGKTKPVVVEGEGE